MLHRRSDRTTTGSPASCEQTPAFPCELHSRRSRQEWRSCAEAGVAAEPALARASDDEQERRLRVLLLDEGSIATTDKAEGCRWGRSTYPARSISILCRDADSRARQDHDVAALTIAVKVQRDLRAAREGAKPTIGLGPVTSSLPSIFGPLPSVARGRGSAYFAVFERPRFATGCHRLRPLGSINAPCPVAAMADW
jgi:hypothetical protein